MSEMTMQLLAAAYSTVPRMKADRSGLTANLHARAVDLVERRLCDPCLSASMIAAALRITPGYLHRAFSSESETISRYILRRRLEECARALKDPLQASRGVASVAFAFGFNSPPHFCRVFRERFRMTPGEYRRSQEPTKKNTTISPPR